MTINQLIYRVAGTLIISSSLLAYFHDPAWLGIPLFVGVNMFQASFTNFCPLAIIAKRLGFVDQSAAI